MMNKIQSLPERHGALDSPLARDMFLEDLWKALRVIVANQKQIYAEIEKSATLREEEGSGK